MFDWQQYYLLARELLPLVDSISCKEALLRSVVSRAYYAAYHRACSYLEEIDQYPSDQGPHGDRRGLHNRVIDVFLTSTKKPEWKKIGKKLRKLKAIRQEADYHLRRVKPLARALGIEAAFLFWGLGMGGISSHMNNVHFPFL
jgi:hypothetical protein